MLPPPRDLLGHLRLKLIHSSLHIVLVPANLQNILSHFPDAALETTQARTQLDPKVVKSLCKAVQPALEADEFALEAVHPAPEADELTFDSVEPHEHLFPDGAGLLQAPVNLVFE